MKDIIEAIPAQILEQELKDEHFIRKTVKAGNWIYIVNAHNAPHVMQEIGRLREIAFRQGGGGSGESVDIDCFDTQENPYQQLIVWNPNAREIIGGYRFCFVKNAKLNNQYQPIIAMEHIMHFSPDFVDYYMPYTIEMSRAFVQPKYQSKSQGLKSLYALDNLWDGIGALMAKNKDIKYLMGKVTIYSTMHPKARVAIQYYLHHYFEKTSLIKGKVPETYTPQEIKELNDLFEGKSYKKAYRILNSYVKSFGESVPPLIHAYVDLSETMCTFGTVFDPDFGDIYDTGMLITLQDLYPKKRERYIDSYYQEQGVYVSS